MVLTGALIKILINNKEYGVAQNVQYTLDFSESAIYGIDSSWPQEIASGRCSVSGSISGLRMQGSAGSQGFQATSLFRDIQSAPYISIRIQDRVSSEDILFLPYAKIKTESTTIGIKNTVKVSLSFEGLVPYQPLDRS
jgi:hypothetical protein